MNRDDSGIIDLGQLAPGAQKKTRVKFVGIDLPILMNFLTLDGSMVLRCEGMPAGAAAVGMGVVTLPSGMPQLQILVHHPDFPVVLGQMPPQLEVKVYPAPLVQAQADAVASRASAQPRKVRRQIARQEAKE